MTNTETPRQPAFTFRDGSLKATIWRNAGEKGPWYSTDFVRAYKTDAGFEDTRSFGERDVLRVAFLAQQAHGKVLELRAADKAAADRDGAA